MASESADIICVKQHVEELLFLQDQIAKRRSVMTRFLNGEAIDLSEKGVFTTPLSEPRTDIRAILFNTCVVVNEDKKKKNSERMRIRRKKNSERLHARLSGLINQTSSAADIDFETSDLRGSADRCIEP
jgi:hypothetical protein